MPEFSASALKWIALISMFCDHFAKIVLSAGMSSSGNSAAMQRFFQSAGMKALHEGLQDFGRLAFVLFAFMLIEGFLHTRNRMRYLIRLLFFAAISEIPFDLATRRYHLNPAGGILIEGSYQNVLFTLALGLLALILADCMFRRIGSIQPVVVHDGPGGQGCRDQKQPGRSLPVLAFDGPEAQRRAGIAVLASAAAVAGCMLAAYYLKCDYRFYGVAAIAAGFGVCMLMEHLPGYSKRMVRLLCTTAIVIPLLLLDDSEIWGLFALVPVCFYDGELSHDRPGEKRIRSGSVGGEPVRNGSNGKNLLHNGSGGGPDRSWNVKGELQDSRGTGRESVQNKVPRAKKPPAGLRGTVRKWFFYLFYPGHLLLLVLLRTLLTG